MSRPGLRVTLSVAVLSVLAVQSPSLATERTIGDFTPGIYECFAEGQYFFLRLGSDLTYQQTEPSADPGVYELDGTTGIIRFTTGPYAIGRWTAEVHNGADQSAVILHADQDYECRAAR